MGKYLKTVMMLLFISIVFMGCSNKSSETNSTVMSRSMSTTEETHVQTITSVDVVAVGDNLYHSTVYKKGLTDEGYDFDFVYAPVKELISGYDIAVVNQETPLVKEDYSSYPKFGTPMEAGEALINTGFDVFLNATNHTYDKGYEGVQSLLSFYDENPDITYLGIHKNEEDFNTVKILEKNDIKIAMLNYTYGVNGAAIPNKYSYVVDTLHDEAKIISDLEYAEQNADVTIVFPHWGNEYVYHETDAQKRLAELFTNHGADVIIGSHPHVCQPVKYIIGNDGKESICYYSLGNFVSGQDEKPRILGGIASFKIVKTDGKIEIVDNMFTPCVTYRTKNDIGVYLLTDYTDEMAKQMNVKAEPEDMWELWYEINSQTEIEFEVGMATIEPR